jgi:radical SAM superfamily enzyme YgiQ (UPF0313 family)
MEKQKVTFIELPVFSGVVPLASGYMEAYSRKDPQIEASFEFEKISLPVDTPYAEILSRLKHSDADVYAFSCYVWNTRLVRRLLSELLLAKPRSFYVLGGPQVMHQAAHYLTPEHDNVFICNGEGERTFNSFLRTLLSPARDFFSVNGLSFYRDKALVTTRPESRIGDLSEIPSPFLEGMFDDLGYTWMLIETNRGCPFKCNYCYWGAAIGAKVYKYDQDRLEKELEWISRSGCWYLMFADANWGMLPRDVDLSRLLVQFQKQHGSPASVYFAGSKNTPDRVSEITEIFHDAGMIACQSVALQTINPETLKRVNRDNIKTSSYTKIQQSLNKREIPSFVELIWPLPGETLSSFQEGMATLCKFGADCFVVYPLLLMNNVELAQKREEYGLATVSDPDLCSEAEVVIQSNEVSTEAFLEGLRYAYTVTSLYSLRGLWYLGRYLSENGIVEYGDLFRAFVRFARRQTAHPWTMFCDNSIGSMKYIAFSNNGALVHLILHAEREAFDELLEEFVTAQDFWRDPVAQFLFEVDLMNRPYVYRNTPILPKGHQFKHLSVNVTPDSYIVEVPPSLMKELSKTVAVQGGEIISNRFELKHRRSQLPFMPRKSLNEHFVYCQDASQRMRTLTPLWEKASTPAVVV